MSDSIRILVFAASALALALGCQSTQRVHGIEVSGFLEDYSKLEKGRSGQARLIYIDPASDFSQYTSIIVDPVTVPNADESVKRYAKLFDAELRKELALAFRVVDTTEPGALRLRVALTGASASRVAIECEVLDASSDTRLVAAVADRSPQAIAGASTTAEDELTQALARWAALIRTRLAAFRDFDAAEKRRDPGR